MIEIYDRNNVGVDDFSNNIYNVCGIYTHSRVSVFFKVGLGIAIASIFLSVPLKKKINNKKENSQRIKEMIEENNGEFKNEKIKVEGIRKTEQTTLDTKFGNKKAKLKL